MNEEEDDEDGQVERNEEEEEELRRRRLRHQQIREAREREKRLNGLFLNYTVLDQTVASTMRKYGLQTGTFPTVNGSTAIDPEVLELFSEAAQIKLASMIRDLIQISRFNNSMSFVNKKVMPRDTLEVQAFNAKVDPNQPPSPYQQHPYRPTQSYYPNGITHHQQQQNAD